MLRQIKKITNIGQFYSSGGNGDITFQKVNLIYGLNGYGKSTLTDIFRSLSNGDCSLLDSKASVGKTGGSECVIAFADASLGKEKVYTFKSGVWSETNPIVKIFDARFVSENIYSDFEISHQHKERLTTLILGDAGTKLAEDIRGIQKKIEEQKRLQKTARENITRILPTKYAGGR